MDGYVKQELGTRIEEKLQEIKAYRTSTIFAKSINADLNVKMIEAEEKSFHALYGDLPTDFFDDDDVSADSILKSKQSQRKAHKLATSNKLKIPVKGHHDFDRLKFQQKAFNESFKIIMKEYEHRKATRLRQKVVKNKIKSKFLAVWSLRKEQEVNKQLGMIKKEKIEKMIGICSFINKSPDFQEDDEEKHEEDHENSDIPVNSIEQKERDTTGIHTKASADPNTTAKGKPKSVDAPIKRKVDIFDLKTLLELKKKQLNPDNEYCVKGTKVVEAKIQILRIQGISENNMNVDNNEGGSIPKLKIAALKVMRANARNKAIKRISDCSMLSEKASDKGAKKEHECAVEGTRYEISMGRNTQK